MSTLTTDALLTQLRNRLLNFVPLAGATLGTRLGGRFWKDAASDTATYPYGIMRLINQASSGEYAGERETADLEVMLYGRPRSSQAVTLEDAADVCDQAMLRYADSSSGLVFSRGRQRDTLPPPAETADREIVTIRLMYDLVVWPRMLTQYSS